MNAPRRVACIGECMIELRHRGDGMLAIGYGGDTLNTAVYLARLRPGGIAVHYVTALGDDSYSAEMLASWREEGIESSLVAQLSGRLPGLYIIRTDQRGERQFTYFRSAAAARDMLRDGRDAVLAQALQGFDCVYLSGVTLSILDEEQRTRLLAMLRALRANGAAIVFDSNYRPAGWPDADTARRVFEQMLGCTDIALPTLDDERSLFGDRDASACARRLHDLGVAEIAVKAGREGCLVSLAGTMTTVKPAKVLEPVDTTAAGDAFNAGYLAARLDRGGAIAAAHSGNALAARVIMHPGAIIPRSAMG